MCNWPWDIVEIGTIVIMHGMHSIYISGMLVSSDVNFPSSWRLMSLELSL